MKKINLADIKKKILSKLGRVQENYNSMPECLRSVAVRNILFGVIFYVAITAAVIAFRHEFKLTISAIFLSLIFPIIGLYNAYNLAEEWADGLIQSEIGLCYAVKNRHIATHSRKYTFQCTPPEGGTAVTRTFEVQGSASRVSEAPAGMLTPTVGLSYMLYFRQGGKYGQDKLLALKCIVSPESDAVFAPNPKKGR